MYEWLSKLAEIGMGSDVTIALGSPVEEGRLTEAERRLGIALPPSYREFLRRWNGAELGFEVLSLERVLERALDAGTFRAGDAGPARCADDYYAEKPAHHLFVAKIPLGSDGYSLATRERTAAGECSVHAYDAGEEPPARWEAPDFEALILGQVLSYCEVPFVRRCVEKRLEARGVRNVGEGWALDWSGWKPGSPGTADDWPELDPRAGQEGYAEKLEDAIEKLYRQEKWAAALARVDELLQLAIAPEQLRLALYHRGRSLGELGRPAEAAGTFERLTTIDPVNREFLSCKALYMKQAGRLREAIEAYDQLVATGPSPSGHLSRAAVHLAGGDRARAIADVAAAIALRADYAEDARTDEELAALRGDPAFERLVAKPRRPTKRPARSETTTKARRPTRSTKTSEPKKTRKTKKAMRPARATGATRIGKAKKATGAKKATRRRSR